MKKNNHLRNMFSSDFYTSLTGGTMVKCHAHVWNVVGLNLIEVVIE